MGGTVRFRKGSKVEVFTRKDLPCGAWWVGEIVSGNGHTYGVRYSRVSGVERVARKNLRPIPPPVSGEGHWAPGDLVEVFDFICWKGALVLKVLCDDFYIVRLLGSSVELKLIVINIRARQLWHDGNWIVMGKGCANLGEVQPRKFTSSSCSRVVFSSVPQSDAKTMLESGGSCLAPEKNAYFQESHVVPARTLKRKSPYVLSDLEANGKSSKKSAIRNKDESQCYPSSWINKVDDVAYPQKYMGETYMHSSLIDHGVEFYESGRGTPGYDVEPFHTRCLNSNDTDSDISSVASCSVNCDSHGEPSDYVQRRYNHDYDVLSSDAESVCGHGEEEGNCSRLLGVDVAPRTHRLDLHAYRCTLEGCYASGPLSWEQETLLTNLRISLNVSNDEHLMMLRDLISTQSRKSLHLS